MSDGERRAVTTPAVRYLIPPQARWNPEFDEEEERKKFEHTKKLMRSLSEDNKDEFLRLLKSARMEEKHFIARGIIREGAVKCAAAVLAGETNGIISPHFEFPDEDGWTVLHQCALTLCLDLMKMFLGMGYSADVRADNEFLNFKQQLPLNVALYQLRNGCFKRYLAFRNWSAVRLLMEFCSKNGVLEIVRLLALHTREFKHEFFNYVKEGKMVEVGALLLVAGEKLMPLCISEGEDVIVFNSFKEISHFLQAKNKNTWWAMSSDELTELKETLSLLDVYDKIGNQLTSYFRFKEKRLDKITDREVANLLEAAGFDVKIDDLNFHDYVNRQICDPHELDKMLGKQNMMSSERITEMAHKFLNIIRNTEEHHEKAMEQPEKDRARLKKVEVEADQFQVNGYSEIEREKLNLIKQPSIPTRHLCQTSLFRNIDSKYASLTLAKKLVDATQSLNSWKSLVSLMKIFRRGVRRV